MSGLDPNEHETGDAGFDGRRPPVGAVLRGAIIRFLPASLISLAGLFAVLGVPLTNPAAGPTLLWGATMAVALTAGYLAGLEVLRRHVHPVGAIDGWRSIVAGLMSPLPFFLVGSLGSPLRYLESLGLMALGGVLLAVVAFFARLTRPRKGTRRGIFGRDLTAPPPDVS